MVFLLVNTQILRYTYVGVYSTVYVQVACSLIDLNNVKSTNSMNVIIGRCHSFTRKVVT